MQNLNIFHDLTPHVLYRCQQQLDLLFKILFDIKGPSRRKRWWREMMAADDSAINQKSRLKGAGLGSDMKLTRWLVAYGVAMRNTTPLYSPLQMSDSYRCQHYLLTLLIMFICFSECASGVISCTSGFCWCSHSLPALQLHLFVSQSAQLFTCSLHVNEKCLTCSLHRKCV